MGPCYGFIVLQQVHHNNDVGFAYTLILTENMAINILHTIECIMMIVAILGMEISPFLMWRVCVRVMQKVDWEQLTRNLSSPGSNSEHSGSQSGAGARGERGGGRTCIITS